MLTNDQDKPSLRSHSIWILSAKFVGFGLSILLPLLTVRYLTQHSVGTYRQAFLIVGNAISILPLGFSMSAYYFLNRESERRSLTILNILLFNMMVGGLAFLTLLLYPQILGQLFQNNELNDLAPRIGLVIWLWIFSNFLEIVPLANQEFRLAAALIISAQFTKLLLMVGSVFLFATVEAFVNAAILQGCLQACVLIVYLSWRFPGFWKRFDRRFFGEQLMYALPFGLAGLLYTSQTDIHNYFVSHKVNPAEFAIYAQGCFQIPFIWILYESISSVVIPRMSELQSQGKKREMLLLTVRAMQKLAFAYFPLFFFLMIVSEEFIITLFTKDYAGSIPIFRINLLLLPFICIMVDPIGRAFREVGRFLLKLRLAILLILITGLWFAIDHFDLRGIISIVVGAVLLEMAASVWKATRMLDVTREDIHLLRDIGKTAIAASISGAIFLVFHLVAREILMEFCVRVSREVLSVANFEKGAEFLGGIFYLGISFTMFGLIYLFFANSFGLIESNDKARFYGAWRKIVPARSAS